MNVLWNKILLQPVSYQSHSRNPWKGKAACNALHWDGYFALSTCSDNPGDCKPGHSAMLPCPWLYTTSACNLWVSYQLHFPRRTCIWKLWLFQAWNLDEAAVSETPRSFLCLMAWPTWVSVKGNSFKKCLWHWVVAGELLLPLLSPHVAAITYWHLMLIFVVWNPEEGCQEQGICWWQWTMRV